MLVGAGSGAGALAVLSEAPGEGPAARAADAAETEVALAPELLRFLGSGSGPAAMLSLGTCGLLLKFAKGLLGLGSAGVRF